MNRSVAPDADRVRPAEWGALGAIMAGGAVLRALEAGRGPMWFDEIYTTWAARGGLARVLDTLSRDVHPPLHTLLVAAWVAAGGESTPWLRSLSIAFGVATIGAVFLLARAAFGRRAGLAAAALLAVHPVHVYFSQEARVYALLWLELTLAWWLAWRWLEGGRARYAAGYVAAAVVALYTHYLAGLVLAFTAAAGLALAWTSAEPRRRTLGWLGLHLAVAALFAPQVPTFLAQNARLAHDHWLGPPDARDLRDWLRHTAAGYTVLVPVFAALSALAFALPHRRRAAALLAWVGLGPVLLAWWVSTRGAHLFSERYMYFALPALLAFAAGEFAAATELARGRPAAVRAAPWLLLAGLLALEVRTVARRTPVPETADLARAAAVLRREARPGDVVYCADAHALLFFAHHEPRLARYRLLWLGDRLPYYEGAIIIPDSLRAGPAAFLAARPAGGRWWGARIRRGGVNGPAAAALLDSASGGRSRRLGHATLWGPE